MDPDTETIVRAQKGDSAAFEAVLDACYDTLFSFAMKYTAQRADAEDITQQACIKLAQSIHLFRFESKFSSWAYQLVLNCARDWHRKSARERSQFLAMTGHPDEAGQINGYHRQTVPGGEAEHAIQLQQVLEIVSTYGDGFLDTLVLVSGEGLSHAQAAQVLQVKESTVSWRIHEIRKRLNAAQIEGTG